MGTSLHQGLTKSDFGQPFWLRARHTLHAIGVLLNLGVEEPAAQALSRWLWIRPSFNDLPILFALMRPRKACLKETGLLGRGTALLVVIE